jgi:uncharacterized coiled-coil DUF342 family protein
MITSQERDLIRNELKRFAGMLDLSDKQRGKLHEALTDAYQNLREYEREHPEASSEDLLKRLTENRDSVRKSVAAFLTAEQLTQWDAEITRGKKFLGQKLAA